jgi:hypothetical protein
MYVDAVNDFQLFRHVRGICSHAQTAGVLNTKEVGGNTYCAANYSFKLFLSLFRPKPRHYFSSEHNTSAFKSILQEYERLSLLQCFFLMFISDIRMHHKLEDKKE